jgi:diacylglycerol O-acyltransferase / wax synthase
MKTHHCIADGIATSQMLSKLADDDGAGETFAGNLRAAKDTGGLGAGLHWPSTNPLHWAGDLWHVTTAAVGAVEHAVVGAAELTVSMPCRFHSAPGVNPSSSFEFESSDR